MRVYSVLLAIAGLWINESLASDPMWLGRRVAMINEALYGAKAAATTTATTSAATTAATTATSAPAASSAPAVSSSSTISLSQLTTLGFKALGLNANSNNGQCWLGSDGPNVNTLINSAGVPIIVVVWGTSGYSASFMSSGIAPLITIGISPGASTVISCADISGGIAAVYPDTVLSPFGQIQNTWVEYTYGTYGTIDISREVTMSGHSVQSGNSHCLASMSACVFTCLNGANTCGTAGSYTLQNCGPANGGQSDAAAMNGGCFIGPNAVVTTTFS